ncbi:hypothetical protein DB88DRAFT_312065 [Papiliotrema laurentii]|uniref:Uncharacterized protein n=1 Tax=Papiliotrema laurentii TaxID=5418 RepID=A0AAD9D0H1_PAPLA|nr:hypothetical protein DB88DRAFT_312065 [Papiliotrema laurentii]
MTLSPGSFHQRIRAWEIVRAIDPVLTTAVPLVVASSRRATMARRHPWTSGGSDESRAHSCLSLSSSGGSLNRALYIVDRPVRRSVVFISSLLPLFTSFGLHALSLHFAPPIFTVCCAAIPYVRRGGARRILNPSDALSHHRFSLSHPFLHIYACHSSLKRWPVETRLFL